MSTTMALVVTGADGLLAHALRAEAAARGHRVFAFSHEDLDVTDRAAVHRSLTACHPQAVLHCAAYTHVDEAETRSDLAMDVNAAGTANVAQHCASVGARLVYPGTDCVFRGDASRPYRPGDPVGPLGAYGRSKLAGEEAARLADALIVRSSWLFGAGRPNFVSTILRRARAGESLRVVDDQRGSPTWTADLASVILTLLENRAPAGTYHAANAGEASWLELADAALGCAGLPAPITPIATGESGRSAPRPPYSVLDSSATEALVGPMRPWRAALELAIQAGL